MIKMDQSNVTTNFSGLTATDFLAFWVFLVIKTLNMFYLLVTAITPQSLTHQQKGCKNLNS